MMSDINLPTQALRRQISSALNVIVQIKRMNDGSRKVVSIAEVMPDVDTNGRYQLQDIYRFVMKGRTADGKIVGDFLPTGYIPSFIDEIEVNRLPFSRDKFLAPKNAA
jgi:pilus assembly protein CpaF